MKKDKLEYKFGIRVSQELYDRVNRCFEWGEKNRVFTFVLEWVCDMVEKHGRNALALLVRKEDLTKIIALDRKREKEEEEKDGNN